MKNKRGAQWTFGKTLSLILGLFLLALIVYGIFSKSLPPLISQIGDKANEVLVALHLIEGSSSELGDCTVVPLTDLEKSKKFFEEFKVPKEKQNDFYLKDCANNKCYLEGFDRKTYELDTHAGAAKPNYFSVPYGVYPSECAGGSFKVKTKIKDKEKVSVLQCASVESEKAKEYQQAYTILRGIANQPDLNGLFSLFTKPGERIVLVGVVKNGPFNIYGDSYYFAVWASGSWAVYGYSQSLKNHLKYDYDTFKDKKLVDVYYIGNDDTKALYTFICLVGDKECCETYPGKEKLYNPGDIDNAKVYYSLDGERFSRYSALSNDEIDGVGEEKKLIRFVQYLKKTQIIERLKIGKEENNKAQQFLKELGSIKINNKEYNLELGWDSSGKIPILIARPKNKADLTYALFPRADKFLLGEGFSEGEIKGAEWHPLFQRVLVSGKEIKLRQSPFYLAILENGKEKILYNEADYKILYTDSEKYYKTADIYNFMKLYCY